jgi:hypothetical protein
MNSPTDAKALFRAFVACLIVVSLPIKNIAYVTPPLYLAILWLHGERRVFGRTVVLSSVILMISGIAVLWDHLAGKTVNFPGIWFGLFTYAPLFVLLSETFDRTIDEATYDRFAKVCAWFILIQSAVGLLQFVGTGNADAVCGTLGLIDGFRSSVTIIQVYFTFIVFSMILFLLPVANQVFYRVTIGVGVLICVLAQSGHQTIFFVATLLLCGLARATHIATLVRTVIAAAVVSLLVMQVYPDTYFIAREWYVKLIESSNSPKRLVCQGAMSILEEPKNLLIGTGLGQYSSRAALMSSNEYLNVSLPSFMTGKSDYYNDIMEPSIELFDEIGEGSAMSKPYMSVVSVPVELGLVLSIALLAVICRSAFSYLSLMTRDSGEVGWIGFGMLVGTIFLSLCCVVENYAEFSQAIFVPFILLVVAGSRARTALSLSESARSRSRAGAGELSRGPFGLKPRQSPR